jgi:hypothetical protein
MAEVTVILQGIRIHVGFYRDRHGWQPDPVDTYVVDDDGHLVSAVDDPGQLGEIDPSGCFQSLLCRAQQAANDDLRRSWDQDQRRLEVESQHDHAD